MSDNKENKIISEKEKELVVARLEVLYPEYCFASGAGMRSYSRDEMISEIERGSTVGMEYVKVDMEFLRAFKNGTLLKKLNEVTA